MRAANAIDFWRGFALVNIFINHMPGNAFSGFTLRNFAISDAAELFVFLAGWSLSYATGSSSRGRESGAQVTHRVLNRALVLYQAHLATTVVALAILSLTAVLRTNPLYLEWLNSGALFYDSPRAIVGLTLLTFQLGYFNILPLYVVLLAMAPLFLLLARWQKRAAMGLSLLLYATALTTGMIPPSWPSQDQWFFNPLSWQLLLVSGFVLGELSREGDDLRQLAWRLMPLAIVLVMVGAAIVLAHYHPDPLRVPKPRLLFIFDKHYLSPARVISLMALVVAFHAVFPFLHRWLGKASNYLCQLGRNSLPVFCIGSLLSLVGQIVRFISGGGLAIDTAIVVCGIIVMGCTAWFSEWRGSGSQKSQLRP